MKGLAHCDAIATVNKPVDLAVVIRIQVVVVNYVLSSPGKSENLHIGAYRTFPSKLSTN